MTQTIDADLCVIGAGSAGLSIAAGAVQMGASTVLIEGGRMGGDCLNTGCVPSKALLAAAHAAETLRRSGPFGIDADPPRVNFRRVREHVQGVIAAIAPHDSEERFRALGCTVLRNHAHFVDDRTVDAGGIHVRARRFVVATGSRAAVPPIPGLTSVPYLTNENIFELAELPSHLIVIGAGPIGCEMAQAFRRLGARVTVLEKGQMMPKDDPEAVAIVRAQLLQDGIALMEKADIARADAGPTGVTIVLSDSSRIEGSHLLVAAGRRPNIEDLCLDYAGIVTTARGIQVDRRLRSSNRRVFAAGDVAGGPQFTHWAGYHAGIILRNALFHLPAKVNDAALPWVTFTDPELAQVGLTEAEARTHHGDTVRVLTARFAENDRARAERRTDGFAKVITDKRGRILGATVVGAQAGEIVQSWALAIVGKLKIGTVAGMIAPYPTMGEINKRVAGSYFTPRLFSSRTRALVRFLRFLG